MNELTILKQKGKTIIPRHENTLVSKVPTRVCLRMSIRHKKNQDRAWKGAELYCSKRASSERVSSKRASLERFS